ncbi:hypothetical protein E2C01_061297 [Portunus trituberculatus]|uniref:Uncharacterized protein n=1 Tax=Portunus trituberculatus TaxID=210409 RepID=A0A5B7H3H1_PORTR|nr:hypothetical protein [Portunus trituberculatus]
MESFLISCPSSSTNEEAVAVASGITHVGKIHQPLGRLLRETNTGHRAAATVANLIKMFTLEKDEITRNEGGMTDFQKRSEHQPSSDRVASPCHLKRPSDYPLLQPKEKLHEIPKLHLRMLYLGQAS